MAVTTDDLTLRQVDACILALCHRPLTVLEAMPDLRDEVHALCEQRRRLKGLRTTTTEERKPPWWA